MKWAGNLLFGIAPDLAMSMNVWGRTSECPSTSSPTQSTQNHQKIYPFGLQSDLGNFGARPPKVYPDSEYLYGRSRQSSRYRGHSPTGVRGEEILPSSISYTSLTSPGAMQSVGSLTSSINDLSFEAEQLERAIRHNDPKFVRRMLEIHHGRFPVNLHGSLLDKSSSGSHSHCVSQDVEILLRKSQTLLDRLDRRESLSTEQESPPIFANALHLAIEHNSVDVARLLLKYGVDPNEGGVPNDHWDPWRGGSYSVASEDSCPERGRRPSHLLSPATAKFLVASSPSNNSDISNDSCSPITVTPPRQYITVNTELLPSLRTIYTSMDGRPVSYDEEYTRDTLYLLPPIYLAVALGNITMVHLLLKYGAIPNVQDRHGVTPLHVAACQLRIPWECIRHLLEAGARLAICNRQGVTSCDMAEQDLKKFQLSLIDEALSWFHLPVISVPSSAAIPLSSTPPVATSDEGFIFGSNFRTNFLKRFQALPTDQKLQQRQTAGRKKDFLSVDEMNRVSPEGVSYSSHADSLHSRHSNNSIQSGEEEKVCAGETPSVDQSVQSMRTTRKGAEDGKCRSRTHLPSSQNDKNYSEKVEGSLNVLVKMATNPECLTSILLGLQNHLTNIIELTNQVDGDKFHRPMATLLNKLLQTTVEKHAQDRPNKRNENLSLQLCLLVRVAVGFLRGGQALQYTALLILNKVIDVCVMFGVARSKVKTGTATKVFSSPRFRHSSSFKENHRTTRSTTPSCSSHILPWKFSRAKSSDAKWWTHGWRMGSKEQESASEPNGSVIEQEEITDVNECVLDILTEKGIDLMLNILNNAITLHKRVVGTRQHCTPSHRWRHCSYHCLQVLSARALLYISQTEDCQKKMMQDGHLKILVAALDSTHDPQLLCLVLQTIATLALDPTHHPILLDTDLTDNLTQLVLPSDEWYYTNHSTKYARYVKHHAARILIYMGLEQRLRQKVYLYDVVEEAVPPTTPLVDSSEDVYIMETSLSPPTIVNSNNQIAAASVEAIILELLKDVEKRLGKEDSSEKEKDPNDHYADHLVTRDIQNITRGSAAFFLYGLPLVVHPLIILRLLIHHLLGSPARNRVVRTPSKASILSADNKSNSSLIDNEEPLQGKRKVNLTINCLAAAKSDHAKVVIQTPEPQTTPIEDICSSPPLSPISYVKRSFKFSSLKRKKAKQLTENNYNSTTTIESNYTPTENEKTILAFQRELQNLPQFHVQPSVKRSSIVRPRSCSVPRVALHNSLQLPGSHAHGQLIRSATTEGTYTSSVNKSPSHSPANVSHSSNDPSSVGSTKDLSSGHRSVLTLIKEWAILCRQDFTHSPVMHRELKDFVQRLSMMEAYCSFAEELRLELDIQEDECCTEKRTDIDDIDDEYRKLQQLVIKGDLPCSKEEAAVLAGIQLRIEETWPVTRKQSYTDPSMKLGSITEDAKESLTQDHTILGTKNNNTSFVESEEDGDINNSHENSTHTTYCTFWRVAKGSSILKQWMTANGNKPSIVSAAIDLKECLPPLYHNTKNMIKTIKEQKRKLFHSPVYESEIHLKKLYIQTCKRLPAYGCRMFQVKEFLRGKTKKKATRLLGIGLERIVLLDSKTLLPAKLQMTAELQQWRTGGGRSHDRLVLEFRATKWSFITPSQIALRSISTVLWEIMQDIDTRFLDQHLIVTRQQLELESRKCVVLHHGMEGATIYRDELEQLQALLHFPEEVALQLTETEYELFYKVAPIHYIRQVTVDLSHHKSPNDFTVQSLIKRFNEVSSWVSHIIISQPTHEDRKAVLSCILRVAVCCWNLGNFNSAVEILAGLKSDKLKPFWLSLSDQLTVLDTLSDALLASEPSLEYQEAIERALAIPHSKIVPFFGTFLRDLQSVLHGMPSLIVLPAYNTQNLEFISDFHGEDHFMTRIGVGGIINVEKITRAHQILDEIQTFHIHAQKRLQTMIEMATKEINDKNGHFKEKDDYYEIDIGAYKPIQPLSYDHEVSFVPLTEKSIDFHHLQCLHHGATFIHLDEERTRSVLCYLKLERSNSLLTWCKPAWSSLRPSNSQDYSLSPHTAEPISPGLRLKYDSNEIAINNLEDGFVDLNYVKEITLGYSIADAAALCRRHGLEETMLDQNCLKILYGANLSDNRTIEFFAPKLVARVWYDGLRQLIHHLKQQYQLCDRRIHWLKEQYLFLFFENQACIGPTPAEAITVFGGRKWNLGSLGSSCSSMDVSLPGFKRASSFGVGTTKLRKKKSTTSLAAIRDSSPKSQCSAASESHSDVTLRKQSPTTKHRRSEVKSSPQLHGDQVLDCGSTSPQHGSSPPSTSSCENITKLSLGSPIMHPYLSSNHSREHLPQRASTGAISGTNGDTSPPPILCRPAITHSSQMDFIEFTELFRSFLVRSRRDLKDIFEQIAQKGQKSQDENGSIYIETTKMPSVKMLGLLTRNTPLDYCDNYQRKKICDAIAAASIVANCAGVDTSKTQVLGLKDFRNFLLTHQGEDLSEKDVALIIQKHESDPVMRSRLHLSFEGFARYLMDKDNFAFVPEVMVPNEEMDRPLSHYFIASSHNTYLTGHQLKGESSVEIYGQVLLTGCRCVELDCWDGDDGMPVIYHGHTLTTKISFKSVVEVINQSAFVSSPYPVILSIENHCSIQQQAKMAQIFLSVFGEKLVTKFLFESDYSDEPSLPTPNQLKFRILIKNKKLRTPLTPALPLKSRGKSVPSRTNSIISTTSTGSLNDDDDDEYDDEDEDDDDLLEVRTESLSSQEGSGKDKALSPCIGIPSRPRSQLDMTTEFWHAEDDMNSKPRKSSSQIAPELSDIVIYCQAIKFRGFIPNSSPTNSIKMKKMASKKNLLPTSSSLPLPNATPLQTEAKHEISSGKRPGISSPCFQVSSINENTAKKLCKRNPLALIAHCETQLMRTYPAGMRIDSSNFNPVIFWAFGIQMVAMNYQTEDYTLHINTAMFEQNGRCGYVMKPRVMWDHSLMMYGRFNPWDKEFDGLHSISIAITVISGQHVCPSTHTGSPQVEMEIIGIHVDCCKYKTKLVQRNSLNPIWNDSFHFKVTFIDLAFLRFSVMDVSTSHVTAQRIIPLKCLKQGYRHVRLKNLQNQPLPLSTLFIYSVWEEEGLELPLVNGDLQDGGKKLKGKVPTMNSDNGKCEGKEMLASNVPTKRKMFFLMVHGVVPDEPSTILKITQDSTTKEVIAQALTKANKSNENIDDYVLIEEVKRDWDKHRLEKSVQRILDPNEHPLEAQSKWQGEGRFILKKLGNDPSTRAWMTTIQSSANKEKRKIDAELNDNNLHGWGEGEDTFLVCVYNVSPDQPYAILKAPISSTAQDIIAQALVKAHRMEDPSKFVLVEELEYPPLAESTITGSVRKRAPHREKRMLDDDENVYKAQTKWNSKGWFELKVREEALEEKKRLSATKSSPLSRFGKIKSSSKSKEIERSSSARTTFDQERKMRSLNNSSQSEESIIDDLKRLKRQVYSEDEMASDDDVREGQSAVSKLKRLSLRHLRVWR